MIHFERGVPLGRRTSFRIGGIAKEFYAPGTLDELKECLALVAARGRTPFILGGGANTLFPDGEFQRPVISTENLRRIDVEGRVIRAECGVRLTKLIQTAIRHGLEGLEGFVGIPGTAGGAVAMNAGGAGWAFGDRVRDLGLLRLDGGPHLELKGHEVPWSYRSANLKNWVVAWVTLDLAPGNAGDLRAAARELILKKSAAQPLADASAGCIFKNPPGVSAGRCIDQLGLKGLSRGGAKVSERHANFIVNESGSARAQDVLALLEDVRGRVEASFGVWLETEIVLA